YPAINSSENEIRIVDLYPAGNFDDPLEIGVRKANLSDSPTYDALSYVWNPVDTDALDEQEYDGEVQIKNMPGCHLSIGENLESALRHLRDKKRVLPMWIDAICIDQHNVRERNHQVQLMSKLYSTARHVMIWLGPSDRESEIILKSIKQGYDESNEQVRAFPDFLDYLEEFLERDWFRRVWIVQELTLAKIDPIVVCG
ncbi:heterokaryon incompatibility protein-domain-containing protein, partial [Lophiotrema nucula]